jgi:hypothetical protein
VWCVYICILVDWPLNANWVTFCSTWTRTLVLCKYIYLQCPCAFHVWNGQGIDTFAKHDFFKLGWAPCTHPTDRTWTRKVFYVNSHLDMFLCAHSMDWNGQTNFISRTSYMYRIHEFWDMKWTGSMHFTNWIAKCNLCMKNVATIPSIVESA